MNPIDLLLLILTWIGILAAAFVLAILVYLPIGATIIGIRKARNRRLDRRHTIVAAHTPHATIHGRPRGGALFTPCCSRTAFGILGEGGSFTDNATEITCKGANR